MPTIDGAYQLLLARLMAIEADMADLRERVDELEGRVHEAEVRACRRSLGGSRWRGSKIATASACGRGRGYK